MFSVLSHRFCKISGVASRLDILTTGNLRISTFLRKNNFHSTIKSLRRHSHQPKVAIKSTTPLPYKGVIESSPIVYPKPRHSQTKFTIRKLPKTLTIQSLRPELPLTFPKGMTRKEFFAKPILSKSPQFYEISLMKSLIGLSAKLKKIALSIGLRRRHQVSFRRISPKTAGQILKLKEIVSVRLVSEKGEKKIRSVGFSRVGNVIGS